MNSATTLPDFVTVDPSMLASGRSYSAHSVDEALHMAARAADAQRAWRRTGVDLTLA